MFLVYYLKNAYSWSKVHLLVWEIFCDCLQLSTTLQTPNENIAEKSAFQAVNSSAISRYVSKTENK